MDYYAKKPNLMLMFNCSIAVSLIIKENGKSIWHDLENIIYSVFLRLKAKPFDLTRSTRLLTSMFSTE